MEGRCTKNEFLGVLKSFWRPRDIFAKCHLSRESLAKVGTKPGTQMDEYDNTWCRWSYNSFKWPHKSVAVVTTPMWWSF